MKKTLIATSLVLGAVLAPGTASAQCLSEVSPLAASDGASNDQFGSAVAVVGDTLFVGARTDDDKGSDSGSVYIFERPMGVWSEVGKLLASDGSHGDDFGFDVAVSGDVLVVGARWDDEKGYRVGSAYVFEKIGGQWTETAKLFGSNWKVGDEFGQAVSVFGDTIVVGAWADSGDGSSPGYAYVFEKQGSNWVEVKKLAASDGAAPARFGYAVAISGNRIAVGATIADTIGAVYVYELQGSSWIETAKVVPADAGSGGHFGHDICLQGDTFVASRLQDPQLGLEAGSAYVFSWDGTVWVEDAKLTGSDTAAYDRFGTDVSLSGNQIVVGAFRHDAQGTNAGAGYLFTNTGGVWSETSKLVPAGAVAGDEYGCEVLISGGEVFLGGRLGNGITSDSGALAVYTGASPGGLSLMGCPPSISAATGGTYTLDLNAGAAHAGRTYFVLGSSSGTSPPTPVDNVLLPLNMFFDFYAGFTLANPNSAALNNTLGFLSAMGTGNAQLVIPPGLTGLAGMVLHHAYLVFDTATGEAVFASNAVALQLTP